ncbi:nuclear intron maturase 1 [Anaeramoeba flamelloides]|uniref:Nuclear intron maturase 1 n=1 Tax=Anaeramoeba flamelloides TaxID=1746091 RepID=A0ABQ8YYD0_9EUKA|nr:nuclear intron maturase 1 [Anaeramoeba flamelloides]
MIMNNPTMEKEYFNHVKEIVKPVNQQIIKDLRSKKPLFNNKEEEEHVNKEPKMFTKTEIRDQIKWIKDKSIKDFDRLALYKFDETKKEDPEYTKTYDEFITSLQELFHNWIDNPNKETIKYIKDRNLLFIHKKGDEGNTLNYRPISINNALARIFLKLIYKKLEGTWKYINPVQYGFRKKYDTRIAVKNFIDKYHTLQTKSKDHWIVTIDLAKCFDSVPHKLVRETAPKFIKNKKICNFINQYYKGDGRGVYQGDPLSPIIFAYISHFILDKITPLSVHTQMYADDLIIIKKGSSVKAIDEQLKPIFKIIEEFGLKVNEGKTERTQDLKEIKYLGIWLERKTHIQKNKEKALMNFNRYKYIFCNDKLSIALRINLFNAIILAQLTYGLDIYNLNKGDIRKLDIWINKRLKNQIKLQTGIPTDILRLETRIKPILQTILIRKCKFTKKLNELGLSELASNLILPQIHGVKWGATTNKIKRDLMLNYKQQIQSKVEQANLDKHSNKNWKLIKYLENSQFPEKFRVKQNYLKWKSATTLFKLKAYTNGLRRYTYFMEKGQKTKNCPCCKKACDDVDHFIWKCPRLANNRKKWLSVIERYNPNIQNTINKESTPELFRAMDEEKKVYNNTIPFLTHSMKIHAMLKRGAKQT